MTTQLKSSVLPETEERLQGARKMLHNVLESLRKHLARRGSRPKYRCRAGASFDRYYYSKSYRFSPEENGTTFRVELTAEIMPPTDEIARRLPENLNGIREQEKKRPLAPDLNPRKERKHLSKTTDIITKPY